MQFTLLVYKISNIVYFIFLQEKSRKISHLDIDESSSGSEGSDDGEEEEDDIYFEKLEMKRVRLQVIK